MQLRFVTLDATGTLFHSPRLGEIYSEVLARHGIQVRADRAGRLVREVWTEFDCARPMNHDRFSSHPEGTRGWWRRFLDRFCQHLGGPQPTPFAAAELYDRFSRGDSWELYPDVEPFFESVESSGLGLAVISNWDDRLPSVLEELGLSERLQEVVYSSQVGFEKPHPGIFESALAALSAEPAEVLHVGDSRRLDLEGAEAIGMRAALLSREGRADLRSLAQIPELIDRLCYVPG
jgi:putative hydrolase of the HAD superfamily